MHRFVAVLVFGSLLSAVSAGGSMAAALGTVPATVEPPPTPSGYRYLLGQEISLSGTTLVTTVGTYDVGSVPEFDNRVADGEATTVNGQRPQVELVFQGGQLIKVVIY